MQDVTDSGHLTSSSNPSSTHKASAGGSTTPPPSVGTPSSPVRPSAYRSMSDTRVKKFDKLLGEQVVSLLEAPTHADYNYSTCLLESCLALSATWCNLEMTHKD